MVLKKKHLPWPSSVCWMRNGECVLQEPSQVSWFVPSLWFSSLSQTMVSLLAQEHFCFCCFSCLVSILQPELDINLRKTLPFLATPLSTLMRLFYNVFAAEFGIFLIFLTLAQLCSAALLVMKMHGCALCVAAVFVALSESKAEMPFNLVWWYGNSSFVVNRHITAWSRRDDMLLCFREILGWKSWAGLFLLGGCRFCLCFEKCPQLDCLSIPEKCFDVLLFPQ